MRQCNICWKLVPYEDLVLLDNTDRPKVAHSQCAKAYKDQLARQGANASESPERVNTNSQASNGDDDVL